MGTGVRGLGCWRGIGWDLPGCYAHGGDDHLLVEHVIVDDVVEVVCAGWGREGEGDEEESR